MTLAKIEGVNGDVFIPDQITDEDKRFLVERTENIVGIVTRAKVEIGNELLQVENHFRETKEFSGRKGWYVKWYTSVGLTESTRAQFVNAALTVRRVVGADEVVNQLPATILRDLTIPSLSARSGTSKELAEYVIDSYKDRASTGPIIDSKKDLPVLKDTTVNSVLATEELIVSLEDDAIQVRHDRDSGPSRKEDFSEYNTRSQRVHIADKKVDNAYARLEALKLEKQQLEAKYEDYRSPEAIKQEFDEAIAKARAEERAKKEASKQTTIDPSISKELIELKLKNEALEKQLEKEAGLAAKTRATSSAHDRNRILELTLKNEELEDKLEEQLADKPGAELAEEVERLRASEELLLTKLNDAHAQTMRLMQPTSYQPDSESLYRSMRVLMNTAEEFGEFSVSFERMMKHAKKPDEAQHCSRLILRAIDEWVAHLPLTMIEEIHTSCTERLNCQTVSEQPENTLIDIQAV